LTSPQGADKDALKCSLETALLTAEEFSSGSSAWKQFTNPFLTLDGATGSEDREDEVAKESRNKQPHV
jgi:hypothetical protein